MSWIALVALGAGLVWLMRVTPPKGDAILTRMAALVFLAAGCVGATGWLGGVISGGLGALRGALDAMGAAAVGASISWIVAIGITVAWICAMLPDRWSRYAFRGGWMTYAGLIIPAVLVSVPGQLGAALRGLMLWLGHGTDAWVTGLVA